MSYLITLQPIGFWYYNDFSPRRAKEKRIYMKGMVQEEAE